MSHTHTSPPLHFGNNSFKSLSIRVISSKISFEVFTYAHYKNERIQIMFNISEATSELQKHEEKVGSDLFKAI